MINQDIIDIILMVLIGAVAGTLAARIMKGDNFGFVVNSLLGIAGAVVGGYIFKLLGLTPGKNIVKMISDTFDVELPGNIMGMLVSSLVGSILILWLSKVLGLGKKRSRD